MIQRPTPAALAKRAIHDPTTSALAAPAKRPDRDHPEALIIREAAIDPVHAGAATESRTYLGPRDVLSDFAGLPSPAREVRGAALG